MNREESRLYTFDTWPANTPVDPRELARGGFFATRNFLEVECNWCHQRISEWHYGDEVEDRHKNVEPHCAFLRNHTRCGNIPLGSRYEDNSQMPTTSGVPVTALAVLSSGASTSTVASSLQPLNLLVEANRLATFKNWPNPNISPQSLAKAGFYYLNQADQVKCAWCKGVIAKWEKQDNAFEEHQRFFPDCPRVQLGPLIEMASDGIRDLGIQQISAPKKPKFCSLDARLRTYAIWPISDIQKPEALAQAGLYYQDVDDQVRCFHCNIGLRSWQKEDDPWFEHAKWYPECQFVRLVKGINYVQQVQDLTRQSAQQPQASAPMCPAMTIEEAMTTAPVLQALEIGIDGGSIRNATQRHLLTTGHPYDTVENLVKAVFGDRDDDEEESRVHQDLGHDRDETGASIVRDVSRIITSIFGTTDRDNVAGGNSVTLASSEGDPCQIDMPTLSSATTTATACTIDNTTNSNSERNGMCITSDSENVLNEASPTPPPSVKNNGFPTTRSLSLEEENRKLKDAIACKVCLDGEVGVVFLPCGHLVTCVQCAPGVNQCPMCRTSIKGFVRTYLS